MAASASVCAGRARACSRHPRPRAAAPRCAPAPPAVATPAAPGHADDALPDSLYDAVLQAAESAAATLASSPSCLVEILVPELFDTTSGNIMAATGDQLRAWELCREFVERLADALGVEAAGDAAAQPSRASVRAVFPDAGAAAMLAARWAGVASFSLGSLSQGRPSAALAGADDGVRLLVLCCPDPVGAEAARAAADGATDGGLCRVVVLNPRLASGDAGIGLNSRRLRAAFLDALPVAYSLRPVGAGTVLRRFPGPWQVFVPDSGRRGRFALAAESLTRPAGDELADLVEEASRPPAGPGGGEGGGGGGGPVAAGVAAAAANLGRTAASFARFMKALSG